MLVPMMLYGHWWYWFVSFAVYFFMMAFGISSFNHRYLSHRSFSFSWRYLEYFCAFWSTVSLQGSALAWVSQHREHHAYADTERDPHSPSNDGFFGSYFLSMMHTPNVKRFGLDLLRMPHVIWLHKHYWKVNAAYSLLLLAVFGWWGPIVLHYIPAVFAWHGASVINAVSHAVQKLPWWLGYRNYDTNENSKNLPLFGFFTFGEAWHNNHHRKPAHWNFMHKWYEIDITAGMLWCLSKIGAVKFT